MNNLKYVSKTVSAILLLIFIHVDSAQPFPPNWKIDDASTDDIKVYTTKNGEYNMHRGEIILEHSIQQIIGFIRNDGSSFWIDNTVYFNARDINFYESCICHEFKSFGFRRKILYFAVLEESKCGNEIRINFDTEDIPKCIDDYSNLPESCRTIDKDIGVYDFYGSYRLVPVDEVKTKVIMNSFIDPGFGKDIFGMFKKSQFIKGAPHSIFHIPDSFKPTKIFE